MGLYAQNRRHMPGERGATVGARRGPRQPQGQKRSKWVLRGIFLALLLGLIGGAGWWVHSGGLTRIGASLHTTTTTFLSAQGFVVQDVLVQGRERTTEEEVLAALNLHVGASIFEPDLEGMRRQLQALPWVESATIERRLPGTLAIKIRERAMLARWQNQGIVRVIDRSGVPIISIPAGAEPFQHLLLVIGSDADKEAPALEALLKKFPALEPNVVVAQRVGERRWNLTLENAGVKVRVLLPEEKPAEALHLLQNLQQSGRLLDRDIAEVDLRLPKNPIVHMTAEGLEKLRNDTKD